MIFLDTSALVKRYVREDDTDLVIRLMDADPAWSACGVAVVEAHVTLCARLVAPALREEARAMLEMEWRRFAVVALNEEVLARAVEISCQMGARTLDSVHLAAAQQLPLGLTFVTFDERQAAAARALGFAVAP